MNLTYIQLFHLIFRRFFIFCDEWMIYFLLIYLYIHELYIPLVIATICGTYAIYISYYNLNLLRIRYGIVGEI